MRKRVSYTLYAIELAIFPLSLCVCVCAFAVCQQFAWLFGTWPMTHRKSHIQMSDIGFISAALLKSRYNINGLIENIVRPRWQDVIPSSIPCVYCSPRSVRELSCDRVRLCVSVIVMTRDYCRMGAGWGMWNDDMFYARRLSFQDNTFCSFSFNCSRNMWYGPIDICTELYALALNAHKIVSFGLWLQTA